MSTPRDLLREAAKARVRLQGACPADEAVLAFYRGDLAEVEAEAMREHLAVCPRCLELARDALGFLAAMGELPAAAAEPGGWRRARTWGAAAAMALAVGVAGWLWWGGAQVDPGSTLTVAKAPYPLVAGQEKDPEEDLVWRDAGPGEDAFGEVMTPYLAGDYAVAERRLAAYLREHPGDAAASFYRGVSLLLLKRPAAALPPLRQAANHGGEPLAAEARWYLALANLEAGARAEATAELRHLAASAGRHQSEAAELLRRLETR
jgi:hypothetical protein